MPRWQISSAAGSYVHLLQAVLASAIKNFQHPREPGDHAYEAWVADKTWLLDTRDAPFSLEWVCTVLHHTGGGSFSPRKIRHWAINKLLGWKPRRASRATG